MPRRPVARWLSSSTVLCSADAATGAASFDSPLHQRIRPSVDDDVDVERPSFRLRTRNDEERMGTALTDPRRRSRWHDDPVRHRPPRAPTATAARRWNRSRPQVTSRPRNGRLLEAEMTVSPSGYVQLTTTGPCTPGLRRGTRETFLAQLSCRRMRIRGRARHREPWVGQRRDGAGQRRGLVEPLVVMLP